MFATIRPRTLGLLAASAVASACLGAAPALADSPLDPPTSVHVANASSPAVIDPQLAVDPGDPTRRAVVAVAPSLLATQKSAVVVADRAPDGTWSWITHQETDPGPTLPGVAIEMAEGGHTAGLPAISWGAAGSDRVVLYTRAEVAAGACSPGSGIYNSISGDAGATWPSLNIDANLFQDGANGEPVRLDQPATVRASGAGVVAYVATRYALRDDCASGVDPVESRLELRLTAVPQAYTLNNDAFTIATLPGAIAAPAVVADPSLAAPDVGVVLAWSEQLADGTWQVAVERCRRDLTQPDASWTCSPVGAPLGPFAPPVEQTTVRPSLAVTGDADGLTAIHLALGASVTQVDDAQVDDALYVRAKPGAGGWTWTTPTPVGTSATGAHAPQVTAAPNGRADVAFLDGSGSPLGYRPYQVSIAPDGTRGSPVKLGDSVPAPFANEYGTRIAAASLGAPSGTTGVVAAVVATGPPSGGPSSFPDLVEVRLRHGTTAPALTTVQPLQAAKQAPLQLANALVAADADGDPVSVTPGHPSHGSLVGTTYTSARCYAGTDTLPVTLRELPGGPFTKVFPTIAIANVQPIMTSAARIILTVPEGGASSVPLPVHDDDAGDTFSDVRSDTTDPQNLQHLRLTVSSTGELTVRSDAGWRPTSQRNFGVDVADCSPDPANQNGYSPYVAIGVKIRPTWGALTTSAVAAGSTNSYLGVSVTALDADRDWRQSSPVHYAFDWDTANKTDALTYKDGDTTTANRAFGGHTYTRPGTYKWSVTASRLRPGLDNQTTTAATVTRTVNINEQVARLVKASVTTTKSRRVRVVLTRRVRSPLALVVSITVGRRRIAVSKTIAIPAGAKSATAWLPVPSTVTARSAVATITMKAAPAWGVRPLAVTFGLR